MNGCTSEMEHSKLKMYASLLKVDRSSRNLLSFSDGEQILPCQSTPFDSL